MNDFKSIRVFPGRHIPGVDYQVEFNNPTAFPFIGAGAQGAVFLISQDKCVKIYADPKDSYQEALALQKMQGSSFFPRLYESGHNYNVMEFITGISLDIVLQSQRQLDRNLSFKLIDLFEQMKVLGLTRIDSPLRHLFLTESNSIKSIDHVNSFRTYSPVPKLFLSKLQSLGLLSSFAAHIQEYRPYLLDEWSLR